MENIAHNTVIHRLVKIGDQIRSEHEKSAFKKKGDYFFFPHLNWFSQVSSQFSICLTLHLQCLYFLHWIKYLPESNPSEVIPSFRKKYPTSFTYSVSLNFHYPNSLTFRLHSNWKWNKILRIKLQAKEGMT